jgi:subtilisin family serine protease
MAADKPDVTAYTHFLGSEALGIGKADSGTSTACPIAAGCVAALRSAIAPTVVTPATLFQDLRHTARPGGGASVGWNADYGHGIIDPAAAARRRGLVP